jgi:hypothetical protein
MYQIYSKNNLETSDTNPSLPRPVLLSCLFAITPPPIKILVLKGEDMLMLTIS